MSEQLTSFERRIVESPDDDSIKFEYADWLDSQGDRLGENIRVETQINGLCAWDPQVLELESRLKKLRQAHLEAMPYRSISPVPHWLYGKWKPEDTLNNIKMLTLERNKFSDEAIFSLWERFGEENVCFLENAFWN